SLSQPYWLAAPMEKGSFVVTNPILIGNAENELPMAVFNVNINGQDVAFEKPVLYKFTDPVAGEVYRPYTVVPPLSMRLSPTVRVDFNGKPAPAQVQYRLFAPGNKLPATTPDYAVLSGLPAEGKYNGVLMASQAMIDANGQITMNDATKQPYYNFHEINYDHIPVVRYFSPASQRHVQASLKIAGMRIGYIAGAGDKVAQALMQMGYEVTMLSEADITSVSLKKYDALVTGVRAYNTLSWLPNVYSTLMTYVQDGGVMLVQYNTNSNLGPMKNMIGPYAFTISRNRVTDETAKVDFIQPANPLLNYPNKITSADFEGWIQERSIYNATEIDNHYNRILSMADPKETAQDGSLIAADYGKGRFIYTGLVFFRELPAGVPGAYRLFANLLARPKLNATK
ncbi:MAG: PIG-L family deacetylase, partial [Ferruginibacter sp.]